MAENKDAAEKQVFDLIRRIEVAQMVTVGADGKMRSRPMVAKQDDFNGELWFFTSAGSGKIHDLEQDGEVLLTYSDPSRQNYVSVGGLGSVVRDPEKIKELWSEPMRVWFPKGASDPDIALVRVKVREATDWDAPSSAFVYAYGYAKAVTTGERPNPGDVGHVDMGER